MGRGIVNKLWASPWRWGLALCAVLVACQGAKSGTTDSRAGDGSSVGGAVIATVDGAPITTRAVEDAARATGLSAADALSRLVEEELLAAEAMRRGHGDADSVDRVKRQSAVQMLLESAVEGTVKPDTISVTTVDQAFAANAARFRHGERRESAHILFMIKPTSPPDANERAQRLAKAAIADLRESTDYAATVDALNGTFREGMQVFAEIVPAFEQDAKADRNYVDALFALTKPGVVDHPVRSVFGWHAIALTKIIPAKEESRTEVDGMLRKELLVPERRRRLDGLLGELEQKTPVSRDEREISNMTMLEFTEP
jgi:hypothetical protein